MLDATAGLRVLDLTEGLAGPLVTMILADFGAEVVRVGPRTPSVPTSLGVPLTQPGKTAPAARPAVSRRRRCAARARLDLGRARRGTAGGRRRRGGSRVRGAAGPEPRLGLLRHHRIRSAPGRWPVCPPRTAWSWRRAGIFRGQAGWYSGRRPPGLSGGQGGFVLRGDARLAGHPCRAAGSRAHR